MKISTIIMFSIILVGSISVGVLLFGSLGLIEISYTDLNNRKPKIIPDVPKDAIPPLFYPEYIEPDKAKWIRPDDLILGIEYNGESRAYPLLILNWHEIVNDNVGGKNFLITYCPLCASGIVFDREIDGQIYSFGNTGSLYESAMVMYDRETESYWWQVGGAAIEGPLEGQKLEMLPSVISEWDEWLNLHPETLILSRNTGYERDYDADNYRSYNLPDSPPSWPISKLNDRLPPKTMITGISINNESKAYPILSLGDTVFTDNVGENRVLIISKPSTSYLAIFYSQIEDVELHFKIQNGVLRDEETESIWNSAGISVEGRLSGFKLKQIPSSTEFWFAWAIAQPNTEIYIKEK
jgi:hypothetical protein